MEWEDYWRKGKENLEIAGLALQTKRYNACASRAYYAVFLASIAAQPAIDYAEEIATI